MIVLLAACGGGSGGGSPQPPPDSPSPPAGDGPGTDDPGPNNPEPGDPEPGDPEPGDPEPDNPGPDDPEPDDPEPDDRTPVLSVAFPPDGALFDGDAITVRGTFADAGDIEISNGANVIDAQLDAATRTWTARVPIVNTAGTNEVMLSVSAIGDNGELVTATRTLRTETRAPPVGRGMPVVDRGTKIRREYQRRGAIGNSVGCTRHFHSCLRFSIT